MPRTITNRGDGRYEKAMQTLSLVEELHDKITNIIMEKNKLFSFLLAKSAGVADQMLPNGQEPVKIKKLPFELAEKAYEFYGAPR